jgi:methylamine---glutamate N-methyltransferase subunit C
MQETPATIDYDLGPLAGLLGTWSGDKGLDVAPEPEGTEQNPFYETLEFQALPGTVENAEEQVIAAVRYLQVVRRKSDDGVFHDQTGYWMWDAATDAVMLSLTIPRGVCLLAGGGHDKEPGGAINLRVSAKAGDPDWGVVQSPFMAEKARTLEFRLELTLDGPHLRYSQTTMLDIYGRTFEHTDRNELTRR